MPCGGMLTRGRASAMLNAHVWLLHMITRAHINTRTHTHIQTHTNTLIHAHTQTNTYTRTRCTSHITVHTILEIDTNSQITRLTDTIIISQTLSDQYVKTLHNIIYFNSCWRSFNQNVWLKVFIVVCLQQRKIVWFNSSCICTYCILTLVGKNYLVADRLKCWNTNPFRHLRVGSVPGGNFFQSHMTVFRA